MGLPSPPDVPTERDAAASRLVSVDPQGSAALWVQADSPSLRDLACTVFASPLHLWRARDLVLTCLGRELAGRLRGTVLGPLWPLLQPLMLFAVYGVLFTQLLGLRMPGAAAELGAAYGVYLFTGALVWSAFAESVSRATTSLVDGRHLVTRLAFPAEILPLTGGLASGVTLVLGVAAFTLVTALTGLWPAPGAGLAWLPVLLVLHLALTHGLALAAAACHVFLRDTRELVTVGLTVAMFVTPVFWVPSTAALPALEPWLPLVEANPLHQLLYAWRAVLMGSTPGEVFQRPVAAACAGLVPWALGSLILGRALFAGLERHFPDEV